METLKFRKNSWHYKLAQLVKYSPGHNDDGEICSYSRHVLGGILACLLVALLFAWGAFLVSHMVLGVVFSLTMGVFFFSETGAFGLLIFSLLGVAYGFTRLKDWFQMRAVRRGLNRATTEPAADGFARHAYKSWKNRFCVKVTFK